MSLQSIKILKAEDVPAETRIKNKLPSTGFIEVRIERNSDPATIFEKYTKKKISELRNKLKGKNLLL